VILNLDFAISSDYKWQFSSGKLQMFSFRAIFYYSPLPLLINDSSFIPV